MTTIRPRVPVFGPCDRAGEVPGSSREGVPLLAGLCPTCVSGGRPIPPQRRLIPAPSPARGLTVVTA